MEKILINIVTHNSRDIFKTLDHLQQATALDDRFKVIIFDNQSEKKYLDKIRRYPFVEIREAKENLGFGHGHNQVFLNAKETYGIICNPDIIITKEVLQRLVERIENTDAAIVVPKVINEDGTTQYLVRRQLSVFDYFLRFVPFKFVKQLFQKRLANYECRDLPDDRISNIRMGSGCFMVIDIEKYKAVGGFDERFFMYFEDNDLCLKMEQAGYNILYTPFEQVVHLYGKGAHRSKQLFFVFIHSMFKFFNKWGWKLF